MYHTTKNGDHIHIKDMDDSHVANTIAMFKRNTSNRTFLELLIRGANSIAEDKEKAFSINGDIAQMHIDQEEMNIRHPDYDGPYDEEYC